MRVEAHTGHHDEGLSLDCAHVEAAQAPFQCHLEPGIQIGR
jgi:hypothetical protein